MTSPAAPASAASETLITRLPPYFPTTCKQCAAPTEAFFRCFEKHAVMMHDRDTATAATSLHHCQPELRDYMTCMERQQVAKGKPWWKIW
ncbi:hypothetical protein NESM_000373300 [Novymonas esmeraldas]|uniref:Uncharacterized protein n=1 Tax=Novymonas esmeraldas TaxID=1808958 RepID=A0AAW0EM93_9TRYP